MDHLCRSLLCLTLFLAPILPITADDQRESALRQERELSALIGRTSKAFVFIGGGSGVLISPEGLLLTNHHVAGSRKRWPTVRVDGQLYGADLVGADPSGDICLLQLVPAEGRKLPSFASVAWADSDALAVGQPVLALGNPFGTAEIAGMPTATVGLISALHRVQNRYSDAIQTDAAVNPGNSGGPLLTMDGKLAGINGQIATRTGARANTGLGYAIPSNQIQRFMPLLQAAKGGVVHHGVLRGMVFDQEERDGRRNGAEVKSVTAGSAAAKAGFTAGDRITALDGQPIRQAVRWEGLVRAYPGGSTVPVEVQRSGKPQRFTVTLESLRPGNPGLTLSGGQQTRSLQQLRQIMALPAQIERVEAGGAAEKAGLKPDDRIVVLDDKPVNNRGDFERIWRSTLRLVGDTAAMTIERSAEGKSQKLQVTLLLGGTGANADKDKEEPPDVP